MLIELLLKRKTIYLCYFFFIQKIWSLKVYINTYQFFLTAKMNTKLMLRSVYQAINTVVPKILTIPTMQNILAHRIHYICREKLSSQNSLSNCNTHFLLPPVLPIYNLICGMKTKGRLQLRCKDCYYLCKDERWYVMCKTHPRHKQVQIKKREYKTWIITWASQSKRRGW